MLHDANFGRGNDGEAGLFHSNLNNILSHSGCSKLSDMIVFFQSFWFGILFQTLMYMFIFFCAWGHLFNCMYIYIHVWMGYSHGCYTKSTHVAQYKIKYCEPVRGCHAPQQPLLEDISTLQKDILWIREETCPTFYPVLYNPNAKMFIVYG